MRIQEALANKLWIIFWEAKGSPKDFVWSSMPSSERDAWLMVAEFIIERDVEVLKSFFNNGVEAGIISRLAEPDHK